MQLSINQCIQVITIIRQYFYTVRGLFILFLFNVVIAFTVITLLINKLMPSGKKISQFEDFAIYCFAASIVFIATLGFWFWKRQIPRFRDPVIGILIGASYTKELDRDFCQIESKLKHVIKEKDFKGIISVKRLPPNRQAGRHEENLKILAKANARVLVYGTFEKFTKKGKDYSGFTSITVSAKAVLSEVKQSPNLVTDAIVNRQLAWDSENTIDRKIVADNLGELCRYFVGLSLLTQKRFGDSLAIFSILYAEITAKFRSKRLPLELQRFQSYIVKAYALSLTESVRESYAKVLENKTIFSLPRKHLTQWLESLNKSVELYPEYVTAWLLLGINNFLLDDISSAKEAIKKGRSHSSGTSRLSCDFSEAFLDCFEMNLKEARKRYKDILKRRDLAVPELLSDVLEFLDAAITKFPERPQIRFAFALLHDEFGDRKLAASEFRQFVVDVGQKVEYSQWSREAKLRLTRIEQDVIMDE